jgi:HSP20 family molecular chaperone IbpA
MRKKKPKFFWEEPFEKIGSGVGRDVGDIAKEIERMQKTIFGNIGRVGFSMRMPKIRMPGMFRTQLMEKGNELIFRTELPGFKKEEIELDVTEKEIRLKAQKKRFSRQEEKDFFQAGASQTQVSKVFSLPVSVDASRADANLEDGVLTIKMPKLKIKTKGKKIRIR